MRRWLKVLLGVLAALLVLLILNAVSRSRTRRRS
jgi:hypothetical protein